MAIKFFNAHNARGAVAAPPVYLIADDSLGPEDLVVAEGIVGLSNTNDFKGVGTILFSKTRAGNEKVLTYLFEHLVLPFVEDNRAAGAFRHADGTPMRSFVYLDGEDVQSRPLMTEDMRKKLSTHLVDVGKTPASTSGKLQSADVGTFFLATKKRLKGLSESDYANGILKRSLTAVMAGREAFSSEKRSKLVDAMMRIAYAIKATVKPEIMRSGFELTGQYPLDVRRALAQTQPPISKTEADHITAQMPVLVEHFRARGKLTEAEMDAVGIPKAHSTNAKPKDERPLQNQRAALINADETVAQYKDHKAKVQEQKDYKAYRATLPPEEQCRLSLQKAADTRRRNREAKLQQSS